MTNFTVTDLGLVEYETAWKMQDEFAAQIAAGDRPPTILLLEHPHVYTFGRRGHAENLLLDRSQLERRKITVHWVDRGGDATYHGPGQLVGYPLIPLKPLQSFTNATARIPAADYTGYLRKLEQALIRALAALGVVAGQRAGYTGVWVQPDVWSRCLRCRQADRQKPAKLAAIGVKVDARGISRHGFALNVDPDMSYWEGIIACGLLDEPVAALADLLSPVPAMDKVKSEVAAAFAEIFFDI